MKPNLSHETIIDMLSTFFDGKYPDVVCVYLYGSVARGEAHGKSDVDIAVLYDKEPPSTLDGLGLELGSALEHYLGQSIDLLVLNRAPVDLIHRVLRDGQLVYDRDSSARIRFEVQARNMYFDLLPYLRQYRRTAWSPKA